MTVNDFFQNINKIFLIVFNLFRSLWLLSVSWFIDFLVGIFGREKEGLIKAIVAIILAMIIVKIARIVYPTFIKVFRIIMMILFIIGIACLYACLIL